jgi:hypothetical protein
MSNKRNDANATGTSLRDLNGRYSERVADEPLPRTPQRAPILRGTPGIYHISGPPVSVRVYTPYLMIDGAPPDVVADRLDAQQNQWYHPTEFSTGDERATSVMTGTGTQSIALTSTDYKFMVNHMIVRLGTNKDSMLRGFSFNIKGLPAQQGAGGTKRVVFAANIRQLGEGDSELLIVFNSDDASSKKRAVVDAHLRKALEGGVEDHAIDTILTALPSGGGAFQTAIATNQHPGAVAVNSLLRAYVQGDSMAREILERSLAAIEGFNPMSGNIPSVA